MFCERAKWFGGGVENGTGMWLKMRGGGLVEGGEAGFEEGGVGGVGVEVFLEEEVGDGSRFCPGMTGEGCAGEAFFYPAGEHVGIPCA